MIIRLVLTMGCNFLLNDILQVWGKLLGESSHLTTLDEAFAGQQKLSKRDPIRSILEYTYRNPKVVYPGVLLSLEIIEAYLSGKTGKNYFDKDSYLAQRRGTNSGPTLWQTRTRVTQSLIHSFSPNIDPIGLSTTNIVYVNIYIKHLFCFIKSVSYCACFIFVHFLLFSPVIILWHVPYDTVHYSILVVDERINWYL